MSKKIKSNTDPPKVNINLPTVADPQASSSAWQTQGHRLGEGPAPRPVTATLPRRTDNVRRTVNCEYHEGLLRDLRLRMTELGDIGEDPMGVLAEDMEEDLLVPSEDNENEEEDLPIIGRDHPASSEAALAGYRYRTNG